MTIEFVQVNSRNVQETVSKIVELLENQLVTVIGFEVVNPEIISLLDINIDPQHTGVLWCGKSNPVENVSAAKWVLKKLPTIPDYVNAIFVIEKLDIDALCALVLWTKSQLLSGFENDPVHHDTFLELCDRVNAIDIMDCGIGNSGIEWNPDYHKQNLVREITPFNVLGSMCSDFRCDIDFKRDAMLKWLVLGELPQKYVDQVTQELNAQKESTITLDPVPLVRSTARGATGLLYSVSPYGVCYNPEFPVKDGTVRKFTVCEFTAGRYLNLQGILDDISQLEKGWGGNLGAGIIGSPFAGTTLLPATVCEIVSRHVK